MVRNKRNNNREGQLDEDVNALFRLPLAEFISARKTLASSLKQAGHSSESDRVKSLAKPSISAWAVNQLYWDHRETFDQLIAAGQRFRQAQASNLPGKIANMREALDVRREALSHLEGLATELLQDTGHNPTPDMIRRIATTLEALSAYTSRPDAPQFGRLTHDVDPPGFESLGSMMSSSVMENTAVHVTRSPKFSVAPTNTRKRSATAADTRELKETRQARITAAKTSLQAAKRVLTESRATLQSAQAAQKKANADAKEAEKQRREAEQRFEKARVALKKAAQRAQDVEAEMEEAVKAVEDAEHTVEKASKELELAFRESAPG